MARAKGLPKSGGRMKGTPNKKTELLRESLDQLNFDVPQKLVELIGQLTPSEQLTALLKLIEYTYPKMGAIAQVPIQTESTITLNYKIDVDKEDQNL